MAMAELWHEADPGKYHGGRGAARTGAPDVQWKEDAALLDEDLRALMKTYEP